MGQGMTLTQKPVNTSAGLSAGAEESMTFTPNPPGQKDSSSPRGSIYHYSWRERGENEVSWWPRPFLGRRNGEGSNPEARSGSELCLR